MDVEPPRGLYSIAAVSKLTGVSCHALRVWERRYGFPEPLRSDSGHRRYAADQVLVLRQLADLTRRGTAIGAVMAALRSGRLSEADPAALEAVDRPSTPVGPAGLVDLLIAGDIAGAQQVVARAEAELDPSALVERLIEPALVDAGERWFRRECDNFQERCACVFLRRTLARLADQAAQANRLPRRLAILGTPQGDRHEGGLLIISMLLERAGWRAVSLGTDVPIDEFRRALACWRPDAVGISFILSRNVHKRFGEFATLRGAPVFVGGRSLLNYQGLARRHGLIPLVGPAGPALVRWLDQCPS